MPQARTLSRSTYQYEAELWKDPIWLAISSNTAGLTDTLFKGTVSTPDENGNYEIMPHPDYNIEVNDKSNGDVELNTIYGDSVLIKYYSKKPSIPIETDDKLEIFIALDILNTPNGYGDSPIINLLVRTIQTGNPKILNTDKYLFMYLRCTGGIFAPKTKWYYNEENSNEYYLGFYVNIGELCNNNNVYFNLPGISGYGVHEFIYNKNHWKTIQAHVMNYYGSLISPSIGNNLKYDFFSTKMGLTIEDVISIEDYMPVDWNLGDIEFIECTTDYYNNDRTGTSWGWKNVDSRFK